MHFSWCRRPAFSVLSAFDRDVPTHEHLPTIICPTVDSVSLPVVENKPVPGIGSMLDAPLLEHQPVVMKHDHQHQPFTIGVWLDARRGH